MILEDVFINLFGTMGEKDEAKKVKYAPLAVTLMRNTANGSGNGNGITVVSVTVTRLTRGNTNVSGHCNGKRNCTAGSGVESCSSSGYGWHKS